MSELSRYLDADTTFKLGVMASDTFPPIPVDAAFLHGRAHGDDTNLLEHTALMHKLRVTPTIVLIGNEGQKFNDNVLQGANPGMSYYRNRLEGLGVPPEDIHHITDVASERHTRGESLGFIRLAKQENWKSAVFPTQPHQSWRALAGTISAMTEVDYTIQAFYVTPFFTSWQEVTAGSQGQDTKPRESHFENEGDRIPPYTIKGDIATPVQVLEYLKWREQMVQNTLSRISSSKETDLFYQTILRAL